MQAINSLKNVDSTALLQFLHPILNMLLHLIGNGGETLQVFTLNLFLFFFQGPLYALINFFQAYMTLLEILIIYHSTFLFGVSIQAVI